MQKIIELFNLKCLAAYRAARSVLLIAAITLGGWVFVLGALEGTRELRTVRQEVLFGWLEYELGHYDTELRNGRLISTADLESPAELKRELLTAVARLSACRENLREINNISE